MRDTGGDGASILVLLGIHERREATMARAAFQVLVLPFRQAEAGEAEFAVLRRADDGHWQGIAGGGENDETTLEVARREAFEEASVPPGASFHKLTMQDFVPATCFKAAEEWPPDTYLVPSISSPAT